MPSQIDVPGAASLENEAQPAPSDAGCGQKLAAAQRSRLDPKES